MKIRKIPISQINPAPYNPRVNLQPEDPAYKKLKKSITEFGYVEPIVWNSRTGNLVGGHQRYKILVEQGLKEVRVSVVDLSIEKEKALNIALNKIQGRWDEIKLSLLLDELSHFPDIDTTLTGFDLPEISHLIDQHLLPQEDNFDFKAVVESISEPITKLGDLVCLGPHKLLCGDSSNLDDIKKLMGKDKVQLIYTDPPYNVDYNSKDRPVGKKKSKWQSITSDNMPQEQYNKWLKKVFVNMGHVFDRGTTAYVWNGHRQFYFMHKILTDLNYHISGIITWGKENFAISFAPYNWQTEHCLFFWKKDNGPHNWYGDGKQSNLWYAARDASNRLLHPTQKPVSLGVKAIKNSSKRGDIVLDMFAGSGSTLIAAEQLERRCYAVEIDPVYCDAIIRRYIAFVGKDRISNETRHKYIKETRNGI